VLILLIFVRGKVSCFTSARVNLFSLLKASGSFSGVAGGSRLSIGRGSAIGNASEIIKHCDNSKKKCKGESYAFRPSVCMFAFPRPDSLCVSWKSLP
jgi:hypothetical protein